MSKEEEELPQKEEIKEKPKETDNGSNVIKKGEDYELLAEDYSNYDIAFKIIVIGNAGVGKSCLSMQATKRRFENNYLATVGFEFFVFNMKLDKYGIHVVKKCIDR